MKTLGRTAKLGQQSTCAGVGELDPDESAETEAGDCETGGEAFLVGEPLDAAGDGDNVGEADARAADEADRHQDAREHLAGHGSLDKPGEDVADGKDQATDAGHGGGADFRLQAAADDGEDGEGGQTDGENDLRLDILEIERRLDEDLGKDRPSVDGAEAELNEDSAENDHPSVHDLLRCEGVGTGHFILLLFQD